VRSPLIRDDEKRLKIGVLAGVWEFFWEFGFWGKLQRRGAHVSTPKIGSRDGGNCFGGIQRFYAELRREFKWRNLNWVFFGVFGRGATWGCEEGDHLVQFEAGLGV
jgi:hypothetical protein